MSGRKLLAVGAVGIKVWLLYIPLAYLASALILRAEDLIVLLRIATRAFRRPLTADDVTIYVQLFDAQHSEGASFEDALRLVALRGRAMQEAAEASDGSMVALIGADEAQATALCDDARGESVLVPANFNAPGQIVISGSADACGRAVDLASERGLRATQLTVAGAFHSPLMQPASEKLAAAIERVEMRAPSSPVLSNVTAQPHTSDKSSCFR